LLKTHKLTILVSVQPTDTIASLKREALSALQSDVNEIENDVPKVESEDDFELCRFVKERGGIPQPVQTGQYVVLEGSRLVKDALSNWTTIFFQFEMTQASALFYRFASDGHPLRHFLHRRVIACGAHSVQ
jgi:hypothetical protein